MPLLSRRGMTRISPLTISPNNAGGTASPNNNNRCYDCINLKLLGVLLLLLVVAIQYHSDKISEMYYNGKSSKSKSGAILFTNDNDSSSSSNVGVRGKKAPQQRLPVDSNDDKKKTTTANNSNSNSNNQNNNNDENEEDELDDDDDEEAPTFHIPKIIKKQKQPVVYTMDAPPKKPPIKNDAKIILLGERHSG